jgi:hypothetical protein
MLTAMAFVMATRLSAARMLRHATTMLPLQTQVTAFMLMATAKYAMATAV